jgi:hypothetical protein
MPCTGSRCASWYYVDLLSNTIELIAFHTVSSFQQDAFGARYKELRNGRFPLGCLLENVAPYLLTRIMLVFLFAYATVSNAADFRRRRTVRRRAASGTQTQTPQSSVGETRMSFSCRSQIQRLLVPQRRRLRQPSAECCISTRFHLV